MLVIITPVLLWCCSSLQNASLVPNRGTVAPDDALRLVGTRATSWAILEAERKLASWSSPYGFDTRVRRQTFHFLLPFSTASSDKPALASIEARDARVRRRESEHLHSE